VSLTSSLAGAGASQGSSLIEPGKTFSDDILLLLSSSIRQREQECEDLLAAHPVQCDWLCQDTGTDITDFLDAADPADILSSIIRDALAQPGAAGDEFRKTFESIEKSGANLKALLELYVRICEHRRRLRLQKLRATWPAIVFMKNIELGNAPRGPMSLSKGPYKGRPFSPGAAICMLDLSDPNARVVTLLNDDHGMIRDPDVSYDGKRVLFSWKKSALHDDYHLYEMTTADRSIRQVTSEPGVADIQGRYLPDGIVYHSSRCINVVVCNETIDTVNLYRCDLDGGNIRRLSYDQVSTQYPSVLPDGRIVYTRWEYNDRGQIFPQGLFSMNPDGTAQLALYGNNSWYPTSLIQARGIPSSNKLLAILAGHHTPPCGKLALIDLTKGQDEGRGISLVAPERPINYERVDAACQDDVLFQHPYPLNENEYVVGFSLFGRKRSRKFGIYYMRSDGARELLAWDMQADCRQPVPLAAREIPNRIPPVAAPQKDTGAFYIDNIYAGQGLEGIEKGTIDRLRVIALDFRAAAVGISFNHGPAGNARLDTPVSIGGSWDVKQVLGDARVYEDGSASFIVPARTPVYFQAIDKEGRAVQSMRSWATLQGGETLSCIGCHAKRSRTRHAAGGNTIAQSVGPEELMPFYGPARGFSYLKEIQPILDRHCVRCHHDRPYKPPIILKKDGDPSDIFCFWPARYSRTNVKQALYHVPDRRPVGRMSLRWLTKGNKAIAEPRHWKLFYRDGGTWQRIRTRSDPEKIVLRKPVRTETLRVEAVLDANTAAGIEYWQVYDTEGREIGGRSEPNTFNLSARMVYEELSGRAWAQSYLSLLRACFRNQGGIGYHLAAYPNEYVNWISPQSGPAVMAPYSFGAAKSGLITMLKAGHEGVRLSGEEMEKIACWIDLAVPYCGDYPESNLWTEDDMRTYNGQLAQRMQLSQRESRD
jgi:hypothetical protein